LPWNHAGRGSASIGPGGFEPPLTDPKSAVLPLDEGPEVYATTADEIGCRKVAIPGVSPQLGPRTPRRLQLWGSSLKEYQQALLARWRVMVNDCRHGPPLARLGIDVFTHRAQSKALHVVGQLGRGFLSVRAGGCGEGSACCGDACGDSKCEKDAHGFPRGLGRARPYLIASQPVENPKIRQGLLICGLSDRPHCDTHVTIVALPTIGRYRGPSASSFRYRLLTCPDPSRT
jgi:hypothetical protein